MTEAQHSERPAAHLVGSLAFESAEQAMRAVGEAAGDVIDWIPDGETGSRAKWVHSQEERLRAVDGLEERSSPVEDKLVGGRIPWSYAPTAFAVRAGIKAEDIRIPAFGYRDWAIESHEIFARLQREGAIAADARFLVAIPTPLAITNAFIAEADKPLLEPVIERALLDDVNSIIEAIPPDRLAIQWDIAWEMAVLEGFAGSGALSDLVEPLARISAAVPTEVPLAHHLCYAASYDQHFKDPDDVGLMVQLANAAHDQLTRPLERLHMPVPIHRVDEAFFAPLADLDLGATQLFLGLVHYEDGTEGARRRIAAAKRFVPDFGVATECGSGRTPTDPVELLRLHVEVAALAAQRLDASIDVPSQPAPQPTPDREQVNARLRAFAERVSCPECAAGLGEPCALNGLEFERPHHDRYLEAVRAQIRGELAAR